MKTFKNMKFVERDYETTNVVYAKGDVAPEGNYWAETNEEVPSNMTQLYIQAGVHYYGWL